MIVLVLATVCVVGLVLTVLGFRGRIISTSLHCRACQFDLTGVQGRCPECGAELDHHGAMMVGMRRHRPRFLAVGISLMVSVLAVIAVYGVGRVRGFNWNTVKPASLLTRELKSHSNATSDAAMKELESRLSADELATGRAVTIMELALERQADADDKRWFTSWGNYLETCRVKGLMSAEQLKSYARHAPSITADTRPRVVEGDNFPVRLRIGGGRVGERSTLRMHIWQLDTSENGKVISRGGGGGTMGLGVGGWGSMGTLVTASGPPGRHTLTARWKLEVTDGASTTPLATWEQTFDLDVNVLPEGQSTVQVVADQSLGRAIESSLTANQCVVMPAGESQQASGMINLQAAPIAVAFDVFWRDPNGPSEWKVGKVAFIGSGGAGHVYGGALPKDFALPTVDVVLRPSVRAATETTNIFTIWGGEVTIRGVPVKLPE